MAIGAAAEGGLMTNREWRIRGYGIKLTLTALLMVAAAQAIDGNVYNGSECTFTEPDHVDGQERSSIKLWNGSGATETISCPLTRDQTSEDVEYVYIIGSASIDETTCKFWEREDDFTYSNWTHDSVEAETGSYNKTRWFNTTSYANTTPMASYQLTCDVPNSAGVYSYYLEERTP
jgi:hypothetical protein